jgi:phosphate transport system ATP-binding protein
MSRARRWIQSRPGGGRTGYLVEIDQTELIFEVPREELTKEYIRGDFS